MAQGNVVSQIASVAAGAYLDVKPATAGNEWVIHNIYIQDSVSLAFTDGTNVLTFWGPTTSGAADWYGNLQIHVNTTIWLRIINNASAAKLVAYDGIQTM